MFNAGKKIKIDDGLYNKLADLAAQSGYSSTDELIKHVLEREAATQEEQLDQQQVEKQLRGLGYI